MLTVHHLNNSRSQRVLWLLEELGCEYRLERYQRNPATLLAPPELKRAHPLGKSPVLSDGARTVAESGAIIEYLLDGYGLKLVFQRLPRPVPALLRPVASAIARRAQDNFIDPQLRTHIGFWDGELQRAPWFAGDEFSGADIQMSFPLEAAAARSGVPLPPSVQGFLERIHARPAYRRALQVGGSFELA
jgi:glutathione S-transferase